MGTAHRLAADRAEDWTENRHPSRDLTRLRQASNLDHLDAELLLDLDRARGSRVGH